MNVVTMTLSPARDHLKLLLQKGLPSRHPPIIVASMGRSGSTIVWEAVCKAVARDRFRHLRSLGLKVVSDSAWDLGTKRYFPGIVYKTHGLADELPPKSGAKIIFLFGLASDAALSVLFCQQLYGSEWIRRHFHHLRARGTFDDLGKRDVLRFAEQLDGWIGLAGIPRLILRYEALWESQSQSTLSEFVGIPVELPPRLKRTGPAAIDRQTREQFLATYQDLDRYINSIPACQVLE